MKSITKLIISLVFLLFLSIVPLSVFAIDYTLAYTGTAYPETGLGDYTETWYADANPYSATNTTGAGEAYIVLNFTIGSGDLQSFNYSFRFASQNDDDDVAEAWLYNWTVKNWVYLDDGFQGSYAWTNGSLSDCIDYSDGSQISIKFNSTDSDGAPLSAVDYASLFNLNITDWHENAELEFEIYVAPDLWGLNTGIIIIGLVMIPSSGLYLVKGGRKEANMAKFYYALVAFFIGWALLIGGIIT